MADSLDSLMEHLRQRGIERPKIVVCERTSQYCAGFPTIMRLVRYVLVIAALTIWG